MFRSVFKFILLIFLSVFIAVSGASAQQSKWYKGNTHVHTTLSGHADTTPDEVAKWYLDRDYNFLILSEHNKFIDPETINLPEGRREDFILIPGEEVTDDDHVVHSTAMNIEDLVPWNKDANSSVTQAIQFHVDATHDHGGTTILNHPNFEYAIRTGDILGTHDLYMFELYNGHNAVNNYGDEKHISTEVMWDSLLSQGMKIYGVSSDDAHQFQVMSPNVSNPGRGWVMVKADELSSEAMTEAMLKGDFYSTSGVLLKSIKSSSNHYAVTVDPEKTAEALKSTVLRGKYVKDGKAGFRIEYIGPEGEILSTTYNESAKYSVSEPMTYLRVKTTYTRAISEGGFEEYYAWGQPVFDAEP
ncbi:MAG: CehA/McbA family metallohydrolase [Kordiimonadaceae bacterium]|nr:CehA/McbA family metallohydrolase [Kordiimonadaceae bacterium]